MLLIPEPSLQPQDALTLNRFSLMFQKEQKTANNKIKRFFSTGQVRKRKPGKTHYPPQLPITSFILPFSPQTLFSLVCACTCEHTKSHVLRCEDNVQVFSLKHVGSGTKILIIRLDWKHFTHSAISMILPDSLLSENKKPSIDK